MRTKKNILLYCDNEELASVFRFVLDNQTRLGFAGYRVYPVVTKALAIAMIQSKPEEFFEVSLFLQHDTNDGAVDVCNIVSALGMKTMFIVRGRGGSSMRRVNASLFMGNQSTNQEWLEQLRILMQRKRGPKKEGIVA